jgi:hypothetical protein
LKKRPFKLLAGKLQTIENKEARVRKRVQGEKKKWQVAVNAGFADPVGNA